MGATILEFIGSQDSGATQMIMRPPAQASKVVGTLNSQSGLTQFMQRPAGASTASSGAGGQKQEGFLKKNKKLVVMMALLMAAGGGVQQVQSRRAPARPYTPPADANAKEPGILAKEDLTSPQFKQAEIYFLIGKRELRAENWLRARDDFDTALQIYGNHKLAKVYRDTTIRKMQETGVQYFTAAASDEVANRVKEAMNQCEAVRRMFEFDQADAEIIDPKTGKKRNVYKEAVDKLADLQEEAR